MTLSRIGCEIGDMTPSKIRAAMACIQEAPGVPVLQLDPEAIQKAKRDAGR